MSKITELTGLSAHYTNHSLRATSASRMFSAGVPEKIVAKVTGHKSLNASMRQYERTTEVQFKAVGESISKLQPLDPVPGTVQKTAATPKQSNALGLQNLISGNLDNCTITVNINSK